MEATQLSINRWMDKEIWYIHTHIHTRDISYKKDEILPFAKWWMDLEGIMLSEVSQTKKDIQHDFTYMWKNKRKQKQSYRYREQTTGGRQKGGD